jgi:endonuclease III
LRALNESGQGLFSIHHGSKASFVLINLNSQREVIPVDTHVHQIAHKHYGIKMPSAKGGKVPMTPKLYEDVATKLADMWGDYAGWAHSVCDEEASVVETP